MCDVKNFGVLWHDEIKHQYPDFTFDDGFDSGSKYWAVDLNKGVIRKWARCSDTVASLYPHLFHNQYDSLGKIICTGWIIHFFHNEDDTVRISVGSKNTAMDFEFIAREKYDFGSFSNLTENECYRLANESGAISKLIEVLDCMQADITKFKGKMLKSSEEVQDELMRRPDTIEFMNAVDKAYNAMSKLGYYHSSEVINIIIALLIRKLQEINKWPADKSVTAETVKKSVHLLHNELYATSNELYTNVYTYFDLLNWSDSDNGVLVIQHIKDDAEVIAKTYHELFEEGKGE